MRLLSAVIVVAVLGGAGSASWLHRMREEPLPPSTDGLRKATLSGGCYWCMEPAFDSLEGVVHVRAGYAGEGAGKREAAEILFDPRVISYEEILDVFWSNVDPFDEGGQFCDRGSEYTSAIYVHDPAQRSDAEGSRAAIEAKLGAEVVTVIVDAGIFVPALENDQNFYRKHPVQYAFWRMNCGRDARLHEVWTR